jgi:hypothetical protein
VVNQGDQTRNTPERRVQRDFVEVLDDNVVVVTGEVIAIVPAGDEWKSLAGTDAVYVHSLECNPRRDSVPGAAEQIHRVAAGYNATEDFLEMKLRTAGLWIGVVLPIEYEYPH